MTKTRRKRPKKDRLSKRFRARNKFETALQNFRKYGSGSGIAAAPAADGDLVTSQEHPRSRSPSSSSSSSLSVPLPLPGPSRPKRVRRATQEYDTDSPDSVSADNVASLADAMSVASIGGEVGYL